MRKKEIQVAIHSKTKKGDIITLINRHGLRINWQDRSFIIPRYFQSDGASVPRFLWWLITPQIHPKTLRGALAHDYIYRTQPRGWTKADADKMFYDLMVEDGFWRPIAWLAYKGVKWFGGLAWKTRGGADNDV